MADYDEGLVIIERRSGNFGTFVWGLLVGAATAILFAPKPGRETRRELTDRYYRLRDEAEGRVRDVQHAVTEAVDDVRHQFEEGLDTARRAMETGKEAARASRADVERHVRESAAAFRSGFDDAGTPPEGPAAPEPDAEPEPEAERGAEGPGSAEA